ncbi:VP5 protein [Victorian trout aquabirnavirus]|uniref:VP5 protein n=1 Tax=Victorian trout aquabirnavirus TaxID=1661392 RepID=UPI0006D2D91A|nr:VP5 protein [Victorian trout aquabirnavirus]ALF95288.1 VP5 protein [Victorian trout aquabirnavirus]
MNHEHKQSNRNLLEIHYASREWSSKHSGRHNRETHLKTRDLVIQPRGLRLRKWASCLLPWCSWLKNWCSLQVESEPDGSGIRPVAGDIPGPEESIQLREADISEIRHPEFYASSWSVCAQRDPERSHVRRKSV